jgi:hypothetical protein
MELRTAVLVATLATAASFAFCAIAILEAAPYSSPRDVLAEAAGFWLTFLAALVIAPWLAWRTAYQQWEFKRRWREGRVVGLDLSNTVTRADQ